MQFLLIARDGTDPEAPARRQKARGAHIENMGKLKVSGHYILGGAILDAKGDMIGSNIVFDFPDRAAFDAWLANDPYVTGKVWHHVEVHPFKIATVVTQG